MGIKDKVGIKGTPGIAPVPGIGQKAARLRAGEAEPGRAQLAPGYGMPSIQAEPVIRSKSSGTGKAPAPIPAKTPSAGTTPIAGKAPVAGKTAVAGKGALSAKPPLNGKAPVKSKVVLEGKALLPPPKPAIQARPVLKVKPPAPKVFYDCSRCPGYCCSYPRIEVKPSDVRRLAAYHGISVEQAERKFTRIYMDDGKPERILRHQKDTVYETICRFFDTDLRRCTIYEGRPQVCREYPNGRHCGYYTFIKFERKHQDDDTFIPSA